MASIIPLTDDQNVRQHTFATHFIKNEGNIIALQPNQGHASFSKNITA